MGYVPRVELAALANEVTAICAAKPALCGQQDVSVAQSAITVQAGVSALSPREGGIGPDGCLASAAAGPVWWNTAARVFACLARTIAAGAALFSRCWRNRSFPGSLAPDRSCCRVVRAGKSLLAGD